MKKFLSLVLALVMTMSLVTVAGASFTDADDVNYGEAVDVMTAIGVVGGYADGSFNPEGTLTRGAAAKIICNILVGPETAADLVANAAPYSDVPANHTFAGYIAYCANEGIISGYADGTFRPAATLTGYAFMKMLLGAVGYDSEIEGYTGTNWAINVAQDVAGAKLAKGLDGKFNGNKALTREEACLYALNALKAYTASYEDKGSNITIGDIQINTGASKVTVSETEQLFEVKFADPALELKDTGDDAIDALDRPAHTWYFDGEKIGTYADTADYVIENELDSDEWDDLLDELDFEAADMNGLTYADTANGKVIELFYNADGDAVADHIVIEAELVEVSAIDPDKVSTPTKDERAVQFASSANLWVAADTDVVKKNDKAVEIANFEAVYEAAKAADDDGETLEVLLITDVNGKVFSVEIPEIVEAKVTRVKGDVVTAGGETYLLADGVSAVVGNDELTVGANGCIYKAVTADGETSEVIYLDMVFDAEEDKWGNETYKAQIVNEDYEIVEVVLQADQDEDDVNDAGSLTSGFYTYELNDDDEYVLDSVTEVTGTAMDEDKAYVTISGDKTYFADDMVVVFIGETGKDLEVTVKDGVQDGIDADHYVVKDDEIVIAYVLAAYEDGESDEVLFLADVDDDASVEDKKGNTANAYVAYLDGAEIEIMIKNEDAVVANGAGFYTYTVDSETGKYTLTEKTGYVKVDVVEGVITQNKYITTGELDDVVVKGTIYDLTDEGLSTLKSINNWDGEKGAEISFLYDTKDEVITVVYVTLAD